MRHKRRRTATTASTKALGDHHSDDELVAYDADDDDDAAADADAATHDNNVAANADDDAAIQRDNGSDDADADNNAAAAAAAADTATAATHHGENGSDPHTRRRARDRDTDQRDQNLVKRLKDSRNQTADDDEADADADDDAAVGGTAANSHRDHRDDDDDDAAAVLVATNTTHGDNSSDDNDNDDAARTQGLFLEEHIDFLERYEFPEGTPMRDTAKALIRFRTNPPHYLLESKNKEGELSKYKFNKENDTTSIYVRSSKWTAGGTSAESAVNNAVSRVRGDKDPSHSRKEGSIGVVHRSIGSSTESSTSTTFTTIATSTSTTDTSNTTTVATTADGKRKRSQRSSINGAGTGDLYDLQLNYKNEQLKKLITTLNDETMVHAKVGAYNDYPCLMVNLSVALENLAGSEVNPSDKAAFSKFVMSYYMGLVNRIAYEHGIETLMTQRQSFGFATPSIADTAESFRVNLGMMPPAYTEVHRLALEQLETELNGLVKADLGRNTKPGSEGEDIIKNFDIYLRGGLSQSERPSRSTTPKQEFRMPSQFNNNQTINNWKQFAFSKIEKSEQGNSAIYNSTRNQWNLNYVNALAFNGHSLTDAFVDNLKNIHVDRSSNPPVLTAQRRDKNEYSTKNIERSNSPAQLNETDPDGRFSQILGELKKNLRTLTNSDDSDLGEHFTQLIEMLTPDNLLNHPYLYDLVTDYLVIYASQDNLPSSDSNGQNSTGDDDENNDFSYGSDSEVEDEVEDRGTSRSRQDSRKLRVKKIIAHSGMDALFSVIEYEHRKLNKGKVLNIEEGAVYYELQDRLSKYKAKAKINNEVDVFVIDANAAVTSLPRADQETINTNLNSTKAAVWVVDTTSSTQEQMRSIVQTFREKKDPEPARLYLVSSGFKNEQMGADKNSYGTIRMVTAIDENGTDESEIDTFINEYQRNHAPIVKVAHDYRRLLKDLGFVPRNQEILRPIDPARRPAARSARRTLSRHQGGAGSSATSVPDFSSQ